MANISALTGRRKALPRRVPSSPSLGSTILSGPCHPVTNGFEVKSRRPFVPGLVASAAVAIALLMDAVVSGLQARVLSSGLPAWLPRLGVRAVSFVVAVRTVGDFRYVGFFKRVQGTVFARRDSRFYSPLCLAISLLAAGLALTSP